ncbi:MAG TPA: HepT-like ribonuclease domain-containing protein [Bacteroidales bacterium]|nr:HepT-like ribonuclease domain-containing protein [Bacteroidales bacterium]
MQLEIQKHLFDIKTSIDSINDYLGENRDFNEYKINKLLKRAIERELEIIGEAAGRILKIDSNFPIENARKIVDLRNWVIHGYDIIDDVIIWGIISKQLPILKNQVEILLKDEI